MEGVHLGVTNQRPADFIIKQYPIVPLFHSIPKIHKGGFPSFHPIVAGIGSLNENLCSWVDRYFQPLITCIPGYLCDTQQVLRTLDNRSWEPVSLWITANVSSLYTAKPHDLALSAMQWFLDMYSTYSADLKPFLIMAIHFLLKPNFFYI